MEVPIVEAPIVMEGPRVAVERRTPGMDRGPASERGRRVRRRRAMERSRPVTAVSRRRGRDADGADEQRDETKDGHHFVLHVLWTHQGLSRFLGFWL